MNITKIVKLIFLTVLILTKYCALIFANTSFPDGWMLYPSQPQESEAIRCAIHSKYEWTVSLKNNTIVINPYSPMMKEKHLPFIFTSENPEDGLSGTQHILKFNKGWLVGFDAGEFGGSLWWISDNGGKKIRLINQNTVGLIETSSHVFVLVGLAHATFNYGKVFFIDNKNSSVPVVRELADLKSAPETFAIESENSIIVLTTNSLYRIKNSGDIYELKKTNYKYLYPNSMIVLPSGGDIYIGMRHFVIRLIPNMEGYREEWFVPNDCSSFELNDLDCKCIPKLSK